MAESVLAVRDCSFSYEGDGFRLEGVSLDARVGEVLGIIGPNGSGKSTLLRLMSGALRPARGEVRLEDGPLHGFGRRRLARRLAFLPQQARTSFGFRVREVVAMGRYPHQGAFGFLTDRDARVLERAMQQTETAALAEREFSTLSGGEKQRVLVAGILAQEPRLMLLDEPTAALDIHHQGEVLDLLWQLSRQGIAVVLVTHDLNAASQFCDRLALLSEGRLVRVGEPGRVMDEELLSAAYGARVRVVPNPVTGSPLVLVLGRAAHETP